MYRDTIQIQYEGSPGIVWNQNKATSTKIQYEYDTRDHDKECTCKNRQEWKQS